MSRFGQGRVLSLVAMTTRKFRHSASPVGDPGEAAAVADLAGQDRRQRGTGDGPAQGLGHGGLRAREDRRPVGVDDGHEVLIGHRDGGAAASVGQIDLHLGVRAFAVAPPTCGGEVAL